MKLAISTCPNDTFAFHAILEKKIDLGGLDLEIELLDIQQLNDGLFSGRFDVAKASFHAAALLAESTVVLPSGSALGFGVGPLLLAAKAGIHPRDPGLHGGDLPSRTLCPGRHTTAALLFQLFYSDEIKSSTTRVEHALFSDIMPQLKQRRAEFGVCIHEGRFTWESEGLALVEDLGTRWETVTGCPLPLGGILANRALGESKIRRIQSLIERSICYANANRKETAATMRRYAQEFNDDVLFQHVDLYVNDWTVNLGEVGRRALAELSTRAKACGLIGEDANPIEVWGS